MPHGSVYMRTYKALSSAEQKIVIDREEHEDHQWFNLKDLLIASNIIWGVPTILADFGLIQPIKRDPTLADGSQAILLESAKKSS